MCGGSNQSEETKLIPCVISSKIVVLKISVTFLFCLEGDLNCRTIMRLFHGEFPGSKAKELGTCFGVPRANIQEFRQNNVVDDAKGMLIDYRPREILEQVSRGCRGLWLWSSGREEKTTERLAMS